MKKQQKLFIAIIVSLVAAVCIIGLVVFLFVSRNIRDDFYDKLEVKANILTKLTFLKIDTVELKSVEEIKENLSERLLKEKEYIIPIQPNVNYKVIEDSLQLPNNFIQHSLQNNKKRTYIGNRYFVSSLHNYHNRNFIVIVSAINQTEVDIFNYLKRTSLIAIILTTLLITILAYYFSKNVFKPITRITEKVKQLSSENLYMRLQNDNSSPELSELVTTFNDMINRIETTFETQNNFVSNASHELRTPLTAIIGESEVCLSKTRTQQEYIDTIKVILEEAEVLEGKTKALLFLAQTGFNSKAQSLKKVRIDQLLWDVKETVFKLNKESRIFLDTSLLPDNPEKLIVNGNEQLLHLALSNVISNACKYSSNQEVYVSVGSSDNNVFIIVKDKGIGIPANELVYIYDPFFRASNTNKFEGYGIGLPLTRNIIKMHKGILKVSSVENTGTTVQIQIPIYKPKPVIENTANKE